MTNPTVPELIALRNSIVKFHQNMKIAYNTLKTSAVRGVIPQALLEAYEPYLDNIAAAPVFGSTFTTSQMKQHLRYLEGILKKFASTNAMAQDSFAAKYGQQPYYQNIFFFGNKIKELFAPIATGIKSTLPDDQLAKNANVMANLLDKVGANFVTKLKSYLNGLGPTNSLGKVLAEGDMSKLQKVANALASKYGMHYIDPESLEPNDWNDIMDWFKEISKVLSRIVPDIQGLQPTERLQEVYFTTAQNLRMLEAIFHRLDPEVSAKLKNLGQYMDSQAKLFEKTPIESG